VPEKLIAAVRAKFRNAISRKTVKRLVRETSGENVAAQLRWFDDRDSSWARKGPVVAFITWCRQELAEPDHLVARRREQRADEARRREAARRTEYEAWCADRYRALFDALSTAERDDLVDEARELGGPLVSTGHTAALRGIMGDLLLRRAGIPTYAEWSKAAA
jgi:hypothetical protein